MASLFVIRGNDQGVRFELDGDIHHIGRDPTNTIQIHDQEVSRHHADIRRSGQQYLLTDLGSSNGSYVNSEQVENYTLSSGDRLQLGKSLLLFTGPGDESSADLSQKIDIIAADQSGGEKSHIIRSMSQEEGSQILVSDRPGKDESPWLARARSNLQVMYRTALAVSHTLDIDQLLARIMQLIFEWVEADRGCIMLLDPDTRQLHPQVHHSRKKKNQAAATDEKISISQTILDYVTEHNEGVLTSNAQEDDRWNPAGSILQLDIREAICVPMRGRYDVVGVIYIDTSTSPQQLVQRGGANRFREEHLKLMIAIGHQAALAVEDTHYYSAMVQAERLAAVGQTIASLSHHIKNILQGIRGGSFLIKDGLARDDQQMVRKGWEFVERNQERISNMVMDMLTFSKEREPEMAAADLNQVVGEVVELMNTRATQAGMQLHYQPAENIPELTFDPEGIHRAVLNIVTNAIDACAEAADEADGEGAEEDPPAKSVSVATKIDTELNVAQVIVVDNGAGISTEDLKNIFTVFMSTKKSRGTGLGLPVSQKIAHEHGGRIDVESQLNQGSRFTLELPIVLPSDDDQTLHPDEDSNDSDGPGRKTVSF